MFEKVLDVTMDNQQPSTYQGKGSTTSRKT